MQRRNGVGMPRKFQAKHSHAETFIAVGVFASQSHETFLRKSERLPHRSKMLFHQIGIEAIMPSRHRSVSREHHFSRHPRHRLVEANAFIFHALPNRFEDNKSAMSLVEMQHSGSNAERF